MNTRSTFALAILLIATSAVIARAGVSTESPFALRGQSAVPLANNTPIELRGIMSDEQGTRFAIYDPANKKGIWVHIDEKTNPFVVRSYDAATNHIVVDYQGKAQTIALVEPKFGPGKAIAAPIMAAAAPGGIGQPVAAINTAQPVQGRFGRPGGDQGQRPAQAQPSADEAKRLDAIRAEVARRRAQREAGASGQQTQ